MKWGSEQGGTSTWSAGNIEFSKDKEKVPEPPAEPNRFNKEDVVPDAEP